MKSDTKTLPLFICVLALMFSLAWAQNNVSGINQPSTTSKLKIAIPVREFSGFVTIDRDPDTGKDIYGGFAIEVFRAVMKTILPLPDFEFVPFAKPDGTMNGTFDDMLTSVASKDYDGSVGEITILHYRTKWVDFTMPYLDSSIGMLVPVKEYPIKSGWNSLIGIPRAILIIAYCFSCLVPLAYCFLMLVRLHHVDNNEATKRIKVSIGPILQARLMVIIFFMILITLTEYYYMKSQSSSVTPIRESGDLNNINQLIRRKSNVGYRQGSFISDLLILKGFSESNLISLQSDDEIVEMLLKGSIKGGVDAVIANVPHLKLIEAKHCDTMTIVPTPNLHATGLGFAFHKESTIISDVSNGILKIVDNGQLGKIQDKTIGSLETCRIDPYLEVGTTNLNWHQGSMLISGLIIICLLILSSILAFLLCECINV